MQATTTQQAIEMAQAAMRIVERYVREGLPSCYSNFNSFLYDFYPDLPWDDVGRIAAIEHILESGKYASIFEGVQSRFGYDFRANLQRALTSARNDLAQQQAERDVVVEPGNDLILRPRAEPFIMEDHCSECGEYESECICGSD